MAGGEVATEKGCSVTCGFPSTSLRRHRTSLALSGALAISGANYTALSSGKGSPPAKEQASGGSTASAGQRMPDRPHRTWSVPDNIS